MVNVEDCNTCNISNPIVYIIIDRLEIFNTIEFGNNFVGFYEYNCNYCGIDAMNNNENQLYNYINIGTFEIIFI